MKSSTHPAIKNLLHVLFYAGLVCLASCGKNNQESSGGGASTDAKKSTGVEAGPVNLKTLAIYGGGELLGRTPASVSYSAKGDVKAAYEHYKKQFLALGWAEAPQASVTDQSASGTFTGAGYKISVTVFPAGNPGELSVMLLNHGNVDLAKLPLPPGTKPVYLGPITAMYVTEASVADTTEALRKLLTGAGWEPHGNAGDSWNFKQGLNRILVTISSAPAQDGKTMISYGSELMSGDLPAPPDALDVRYVESQRKLDFTTAGDKEGVFAYYKQALAKSGWKPNREEPWQDDEMDKMVFRNGDGIIFLDVMREQQGKRQVTLSATTVTEMDEAGARIKAKIAADKKAEAEKEAAKPQAPKVSITVPDGASGVERAPGRIKFIVANGKAKGVVEAWQKQLLGDGWKEEAGTLTAMAGMLSLSKGEARISINFTDTGFTPAEVEVTVIGAGLE